MVSSTLCLLSAAFPSYVFKSSGPLLNSFSFSFSISISLYLSFLTPQERVRLAVLVIHVPTGQADARPHIGHWSDFERLPFSQALIPNPIQQARLAGPHGATQGHLRTHLGHCPQIVPCTTLSSLILQLERWEGVIKSTSGENRNHLPLNKVDKVKF